MAGGRSNLDDVAAQMLGHALSAEGARVTALPRVELTAMNMQSADEPDPDCVILSFLNPTPARASLLIVRRIKRALPGIRVGAVIWEMPGSLRDAPGLSPASGPTIAVALRELEAIGADFVATTMDEAMTFAFADVEPKPLPELHLRPPRTPVKLRADTLARQA